MVFWTILRREAFQLVRSVHGLAPLFLALAGAGSLLVWLLYRAEGTATSLPAVWGLATAFGLPFLAAVAASRGFTQDREVGMLRLMFSTPVRARWWVLGKVLAAWLGFAQATLALAAQALLWCGVGTLVSLFFRSSASTFLITLLTCLLAPPALCMMLSMTFGRPITQWPLFPLQMSVLDCAGGLVDVRVLMGCLMSAAVVIYAAGMAFDALRLCATER